MEERVRILGLLPEVLRRAEAVDPIFQGLVLAMSDMRSPIVAHLDALHDRFDPDRATPGALLAMSRWLGIPDGHPIDARARAALVREAIELARWRGTRSGLLRYLELALGVAGCEVRDDEHPFHLVVRIPSELERERKRITHIVAHQKPAHLTFTIEAMP